MIFVAVAAGWTPNRDRHPMLLLRLPPEGRHDELFWIRREEKYGPPKIKWRSDPRELGLSKMDFNPEDVPWQEREPWRTIKTYLPPAMMRHNSGFLRRAFPLPTRRRYDLPAA